MFPETFYLFFSPLLILPRNLSSYFFGGVIYLRTFLYKQRNDSKLITPHPPSSAMCLLKFYYLKCVSARHQQKQNKHAQDACFDKGVTECICTLCLCCCTLYIACQCSFVYGRHSIFYVCFMCCYFGRH